MKILKDELIVKKDDSLGQNISNKNNYLSQRIFKDTNKSKEKETKNKILEKIQTIS